MSNYKLGDRFVGMVDLYEITSIKDVVDSYGNLYDQEFILTDGIMGTTNHFPSVKRLDVWLGTHNFVHEPVKVEEVVSADALWGTEVTVKIEPTCTCEIRDLMMQGCRCGYLVVERNS
jgi:hypothetical protein